MRRWLDWAVIAGAAAGLVVTAIGMITSLTSVTRFLPGIDVWLYDNRWYWISFLAGPMVACAGVLLLYPLARSKRISSSDSEALARQTQAISPGRAWPAKIAGVLALILGICGLASPAICKWTNRESQVGLGNALTPFLHFWWVGWGVLLGSLGAGLWWATRPQKGHASTPPAPPPADSDGANNRLIT